MRLRALDYRTRRWPPPARHNRGRASRPHRWAHQPHERIRRDGVSFAACSNCAPPIQHVAEHAIAQALLQLRCPCGRHPAGAVAKDGLLIGASTRAVCCNTHISKLVRRAGTRAERELWEHARMQRSAPIRTWMLLTSVPADGGARPQSQEVVIGNEGTRTRFRTTPHIMEAEREGTERKARTWRA